MLFSFTFKSKLKFFLRLILAYILPGPLSRRYLFTLYTMTVRNVENEWSRLYTWFYCFALRAEIEVLTSIYFSLNPPWPAIALLFVYVVYNGRT